MDEMRQFILDNAAEVRELILTASEEWLIKMVRQKGVATSVWVAGELGITTKTAASRLRNLTRKGYLVREEVVIGSGGQQFYYQINDG